MCVWDVAGWINGVVGKQGLVVVGVSKGGRQQGAGQEHVRRVLGQRVLADDVRLLELRHQAVHPVLLLCIMGVVVVVGWVGG